MAQKDKRRDVMLGRIAQLTTQTSFGQTYQAMPNLNRNTC